MKSKQYLAARGRVYLAANISNGLVSNMCTGTDKQTQKYFSDLIDEKKAAKPLDI